MRDLVLTQEARAARNAASIARADEGPGNSAIKLYTAQGGTLVAVRQLGKPCGSVREADGRMVLVPGAQNDLVLVTGAANWGEWCAGDGVALYVGPVTDEHGMASDGAGGLVDTGGIGPWVLEGTRGTQLYEGGLVLLRSAVIW